MHWETRTGTPRCLLHIHTWSAYTEIWWSHRRWKTDGCYLASVGSARMSNRMSRLTWDHAQSQQEWCQCLQYGCRQTLHIGRWAKPDEFWFVSIKCCTPMLNRQDAVFKVMATFTDWLDSIGRWTVATTQDNTLMCQNRLCIHILHGMTVNNGNWGQTIMGRKYRKYKHFSVSPSWSQSLLLVAATATTNSVLWQTNLVP